MEDTVGREEEKGFGELPYETHFITRQHSCGCPWEGGLCDPGPERCTRKASRRGQAEQGKGGEDDQPGCIPGERRGRDRASHGGRGGMKGGNERREGVCVDVNQPPCPLINGFTVYSRNLFFLFHPHLSAAWALPPFVPPLSFPPFLSRRSGRVSG